MAENGPKHVAYNAANKARFNTVQRVVTCNCHVRSVSNTQHVTHLRTAAVLVTHNTAHDR